MPQKPESNSKLKIKYVRKAEVEKPPFVDQFGQASTSVNVLRTLSHSMSINGVTPRQFLANYDNNSSNADKAAAVNDVTDLLEDAIDAAERDDRAEFQTALECIEAKLQRSKRTE